MTDLRVTGGRHLTPGVACHHARHFHQGRSINNETVKYMN